MSTDATQPTSQKYIDGAIDPDKIPDRVRHGMLIKRYLVDVRDFLVQQLPPEDDAILYAAATGDESWESAEAARYRDLFLGVCASRGSKNAVSLERESLRIENEFNDRRAARYKSTISSLSESGRAVVEKFIDTEIVPNSIAADLDSSDSLARQNPDEFLYQFDLQCHFMATGEWPQEAQERLEQFRKERDESRRQSEPPEDKQ